MEKYCSRQIPADDSSAVFLFQKGGREDRQFRELEYLTGYACANRNTVRVRSLGNRVGGRDGTKRSTAARIGQTLAARDFIVTWYP